MQIHSIDPLNMTVRNLQESVEWYGRVFGFRQVEEGRNGDSRWAIVRSGEAMLCLYECPSLGSFDAEASPTQRIYHYGFRIADAAAWKDTVKREGLRITFGPYLYPHSVSWYLDDPNGYEIEVACWDNNAIQFDNATAVLQQRAGREES